MKPIITSVLDNDLYKFTMLNGVLKLYKGAYVEYKFYNRDPRPYPTSFFQELKRQISYLDKLRLTQVEEIHLRKKYGHLFGEEFFYFLSNFRFDSSQVTVKLNSIGELTIIIKGCWEDTILYEVPVMAIISELFFCLSGDVIDMEEFKRDTYQKGVTLRNEKIPYMEFGTRRRLSKLAQSIAISILKQSGTNFLGTSNVYLGMIHEVKVFGTVAHEWVMYHGAKFGYKKANSAAVTAWKQIYGEELNVALPDTYTSKVFYDTLEKGFLAKITHVRQDSGEPNDFTDLSIMHYGIFAKYLTILYSDGLNVDKVLDIEAYRKGEVQKTYCLGTSLTNDFKGVKPLNIVIKLDSVDGIQTVKLSDTSGKHTGDPGAIEECLKELEL